MRSIFLVRLFVIQQFTFSNEGFATVFTGIFILIMGILDMIIQFVFGFKAFSTNSTEDIQIHVEDLDYQLW